MWGEETILKLSIKPKEIKINFRFSLGKIFLGATTIKFVVSKASENLR